MLELSKKYLNTPKETLIFEDIKPLQELIKYHSDLYYNKESPVISDVEYDELFEKLKFIEEKFNLNIKQTSFV
jgi:DNA ligase (NAD+)